MSPTLDNWIEDKDLLCDFIWGSALGIEGYIPHRWGVTERRVHANAVAVTFRGFIFELDRDWKWLKLACNAYSRGKWEWMAKEKELVAKWLRNKEKYKKLKLCDYFVTMKKTYLYIRVLFFYILHIDEFQTNLTFVILHFHLHCIFYPFCIDI